MKHKIEKMEEALAHMEDMKDAIISSQSFDLATKARDLELGMRMELKSLKLEIFTNEDKDQLVGASRKMLSATREFIDALKNFEQIRDQYSDIMVDLAEKDEDLRKIADEVEKMNEELTNALN